MCLPQLSSKTDLVGAALQADVTQLKTDLADIKALLQAQAADKAASVEPSEVNASP